ncbi:MAG: hypothetical protein A2942_02685 [Candidatus Lloydbacteria bacterium RIFCSPLOWO2_01_FULL_50_20]|uniref:FAD-dependent oxidoreductase n=1 Tax=Candidatus Lloydbacteria bacterium RIFCSPLOWO2_01_FULL_50_20 TaxID=1798665 RepID=A0A1G2DHH5_9BACT|nr:MAG: hypothetical protein A3C13_04800 [Candidatus Lloydbacteria bacterium RIFCSPHIGHO2_02_FULL_50_11]OGZ12258.1 MAG: hypothetical protein A2942_02685 [Candidatus Lloydbacteria bacterium RIFCSPLOWO2_01_FULL_50_20]
MKKVENENFDVIVIGGGPGGMMAAGRAAESGAKVLLLEKNPALGKKLLLSGGGRSNITNNELSVRKFLEKFKGKGKFLFSAFSQFGVGETLDFFHAHGMPTKLEAEGRVFPKTERSASVHDALRVYMKKWGVVVHCNSEVSGFQTVNGAIVGIKLKNGQHLSARSYILSTGGTSRPDTGSTGDGFQWLKKFGHSVRQPTPALVPIRTKEMWAHKLTGISFKEAKASMLQNGVPQRTRTGKILFTHIGLSGPLILNMSKDIGELLKYGKVALVLDLFPRLDHGALDRSFQATFQKLQNKKLKNVLPEIVPAAFARLLPELLKLDGNKEINKVSRTERMVLVKFLKAISLTPTGVLGLEKAVVISGGVPLTEVDTRTMRSKKHGNLYLIGDIIDIDRPSGGYSLQFCWTTGWVAGTYAAKKS